MAIPVKYRKSPELIATYDWTDVASGLGFVDVKGYVTDDYSGVKNYHLGTSDLYSSNVESLSESSVLNVYVQKVDVDFDASPFQFPRTIKGTGTINFCAGIRKGSGTGADYWGYYDIKLKKWDGTTETEIAAASGAIVENSSTGDKETIQCVPLTIPETRFEAGETLRLTMQGYVKSDGTDAVSSVLGHDPQNRDGTYIVPTSDKLMTKFNFHCPFKIRI